MIWDTIQNKLENVGKVLDGRQDSLACSATRSMAQPGQPDLEAYLGPSGSGAGTDGQRARSPLAETQPGGARMPPQVTMTQQATMDRFFKRKPEAGAGDSSPLQEQVAKRTCPS